MPDVLERAHSTERPKPDGRAGGGEDRRRLRADSAPPHAGANYDVSTDDVVARLRQWETLCTFHVVGAAASWVALQFETLPEKLCAFAEDVYPFCPDTVTQGVGLARERDNPERFAVARALCPEISARVRTRSNDALAQIEAMDPQAARQFRDLLHAASALSHPDEADGVRLLAEELRRRKCLHLWWD